jgi:hypothetical protein
MHRRIVTTGEARRRECHHDPSYSNGDRLGATNTTPSLPPATAA